MSAVTKLTEFLQQHIRLRADLLAGTQAVVAVLRLRLDASGAISTAELASPSGVPALDEDLTTQARSLVEQHTHVETLTPEEVAVVAGRAVRVRIPLAPPGL